MKSFFLKPACIAATLITSAFSVQAQQTYIDVNVGYGFGTNGNTEILSNTTGYNSYPDDEYYSTSELVKLSLGKGMNFGLNVGHMFNTHIGVDLGLNYHLGGITKGTDEYTYVEEDWLTGNRTTSTSKTETEISSNMFQFTPSFVIATGGEKVNIYSKMGVIMGFGNILINMNDESNNSNTSSTSEIQQKLDGGMSVGFSGAIGCNYLLSEKLSIFGEANYIGLSYAPAKGKVTKYEENGVDLLPLLSTYEKEVNFVDKTSDNNSFASPSDPNAPSESLKISLPYSSIGLKVGVRFNL